MTRDQMLTRLRADRDAAAARLDHAEALILNDRIKALKEARSEVVEQVMQCFESALARKRFYVVSTH